MNYETARQYFDKAKAIGASKGVEVSVAVVDASGRTVMLGRGKEEAWHGPYMAAGKARLAAAFRKPTIALIEQWADRPLYPMSLTTIIPEGVTLNPGGYPIFAQGACIGAIGIGGGAPALDDEIARLTVEAMDASGAEAHSDSRQDVKKIPIRTEGAPTPTGPFNQAIRAGNLVFTSGQAGRNRETGKMGDIRDQARRCIGNIGAVLEAAGSSLAHVVKVTVFLRNSDDWKAFNEEYVKLMPPPLPARTSAIVDLKGPDMLVEMEVIACVADQNDEA